MNKKCALLLWICMSFMHLMFAQCTSNRYLDTIFPFVSKTSQILYGNADPYLGLNQDLYLDFYEPTGDTLQLRPLIIYAFGGAFLIGDKNQPPIPTYCTHFAKAGYAVVSIDYRIGFNAVSTGSCERAVVRAVQDLRAAIRFLAQRATTFKIDTSAIFLTGSSAGCIAGLHSAFMRESEVPVSAQGILLEPSDLGCIDCSGNTDFNKRVPKPRGILNHWGAILDTSFITKLPEDSVPVLSIHGDADPLVPFNSGSPFSYPVFPTVYGSNPIHRRMDNLGIKNELIVLKNYLHETWLTNPEVLDSAFVREKPFMYSILKPPAQKIAGVATICVNDIGRYDAVLVDKSRYCFSINGGGTILSQNANQLSVKWTSVGTFTVSVRELNRNEVQGDIATFLVNVIDRPKAKFGVSANELKVTITDSSLNTTNWNYLFSQGGSSTLQNPSYTYTSPGVKQIRLIARNGFCADTFYRTIDIDTCPKPSFSYTVVGDSVYFLGNISNGIKYTWTFGDGTKDSSNTNPIHIYNASQNYLVGLTVTNSKGCKVSTSQILPFSKPNGIDNLREDLFFYPNPTKGILQVKKEGNYTIYSLSGKRIFNAEKSIGTFIDLSLQAKGIYWIELNVNGILQKQKLILE